MEKDYTTSILVNQSPEQVFNAIIHVRDWWQGEIIGDTGKKGDEFTYQMGEVHFSKQLVTEFIPNEKLAWRVTESRINFVTDKQEWVDTEIVFQISPEGSQTKLTFTHRGLVPSIECYGGCSGAWEGLIEKSLFSLITTGKGVDIF